MLTTSLKPTQVWVVHPSPLLVYVCGTISTTSSAGFWTLLKFHQFCTRICLAKDRGAYDWFLKIFSALYKCTNTYLLTSPVWVPELRIDPLRLLAGCRKRRLNQAPLNLCGLIWLLMMDWSERGNFQKRGPSARTQLFAADRRTSHGSKKEETLGRATEDGQTPQSSVTVVCISCIRCSLKALFYALGLRRMPLHSYFVVVVDSFHFI